MNTQATLPDVIKPGTSHSDIPVTFTTPTVVRKVMTIAQMQAQVQKYQDNVQAVNSAIAYYQSLITLAQSAVSGVPAKEQ